MFDLGHRTRYPAKLMTRIQFSLLVVIFATLFGCTNTEHPANPASESTRSTENRPFNEISSVVVSADLCNANPLEPNEIRELLASATLIPSNAPILRDWHYAPWCSATFNSGDRKWKVAVCLGGLAFVADDQDVITAYMLDVKSLSR